MKKRKHGTWADRYSAIIYIPFTLGIYARESLIKCSIASWPALRRPPSAAKAAYLAGSSGTAEAVPYPEPSKTNLIRDSLAA